MGAKANRDTGALFEDLFKKMAQMNGLLPIKNYLTARIIYAGKIQLMKSELDYKLINQDGQVGYFDCKTYDDKKFSYSNLEPKQIERAKLYYDWGVPSGFVVWFRESNRVIFFTGKDIVQKGPGNSFNDQEGLWLGRAERFDLKGLLIKNKPG